MVPLRRVGLLLLTTLVSSGIHPGFANGVRAALKMSRAGDAAHIAPSGA